jgi:hypothetical protein
MTRRTARAATLLPEPERGGSMATKADFTEDEWKALQKGVTGSGMLVSVSDRDFTDTFGEASALAKYVAGQHETNENPLIREIAGGKGSGFGMTASVDKVEAETFASLQTALEALQTKAPDAVEPYRQLVLGVAAHVAEAKGGGTSETEAAMLERIKEAVAAPS